MEDDYDLEAIYAADPVGATNAVIAQAAAVTAEEIAALNVDHRERDWQRIYGAQVETATAAAGEALTEKYGEDTVAKLMPRVEEHVRNSPHLVPNDVRTSPSQLTQSLEAVLLLAKSEYEADEKKRSWENIKNHGSPLSRIVS